MYNQEQKMRFLDEYTQSLPTTKRAITVFNAAQLFEEEWGADLCTKTPDELHDLMVKVSGLRQKSATTSIVVLNEYRKWCVRNEIDGADETILKVSDVGLDKVRKQTLANPKHLQKYLDAILEPVEKQTAGNVLRCYFWLAYAGMKEEHILEAKCSDVDFANMVVHYPQKNTVIPIYVESLPALHLCAESSQFTFTSAHYEIKRDRVPGDLLLRGIRGDQTTCSIRAQVSRAAKQNEDKTGMRISYKRAWLSGVFYRMYEDELAGIKPDFNPIVIDHMREITYKLDSGSNTLEDKQRYFAKAYMADYERWKAAWIYRN